MPAAAPVTASDLTAIGAGLVGLITTIHSTVSAPSHPYASIAYSWASTKLRAAGQFPSSTSPFIHSLSQASVSKSKPSATEYTVALGQLFDQLSPAGWNVLLPPPSDFDDDDLFAYDYVLYSFVARQFLGFCRGGSLSHPSFVPIHDLLVPFTAAIPTDSDDQSYSQSAFLDLVTLLGKIIRLHRLGLDVFSLLNVCVEALESTPADDQIDDDDLMDRLSFLAGFLMAYPIVPADSRAWQSPAWSDPGRERLVKGLDVLLTRFDDFSPDTPREIRRQITTVRNAIQSPATAA